MWVQELPTKHEDQSLIQQTHEIEEERRKKKRCCLSYKLQSEKQTPAFFWFHHIYVMESHINKSRHLTWKLTRVLEYLAILYFPETTWTGH